MRNDIAEMEATCATIAAGARNLKIKDRFRYFAQALPLEVLLGALEGAEAARNGLQGPYVPLAVAICFEVRRLLYGNVVSDESRAEVIYSWVLDIQLALMCEHLRRQGVIKAVPRNPFSKLQTRIALSHIRTA
jgi:hypothetical protein